MANIRMVLPIKAAKHVSSFFLFELGSGVAIGGGSADARFAWRLRAGTSFWGVTK